MIRGFFAYPLIPSEEAVCGIRYDFNDGCRVLFPETPGRYGVRLTDLDSGLETEETEVCPGGKFNSRLRYFVRWRLEIFKDGELVFTHDMDCKGKEVLLELESDAIGDTIAWFSYAERFRRRHGCRLGVAMNPEIAAIFKRTYPEIDFFTRKERQCLAPYATYRLGVKYGDDGRRQKRDYHQVSLDAMAGYDLGLDDEIKPQEPDADLAMTDSGAVPEPHVCVAFHASMRMKEWLCQDGWDKVVDFLKARGYRVLCIDRGTDELHGAEDFTGDRPLQERLASLRGARLFIGTSSGLAWLAWAAGCKVVMISGFTEPWTEMPCIRIQNPNVCHGCWNDCKHQFKPGQTDWCPRERNHECSKSITADMVISALTKELGDKTE